MAVVLQVVEQSSVAGALRLSLQVEVSRLVEVVLHGSDEEVGHRLVGAALDHA